MSFDQRADSEISVRVEGGVGAITLSRRSLTRRIKQALLEAVRSMSSDDSVRAILLTGQGTVFSAGQDLGEHAAALEDDPGTAFATLTEHYNPLLLALTEAPKPVVAAVNGTCAGAGISLALACDVRVASASATFAPAFTGIGLTFDTGLSATLTRAIGASRTSELMMLGRAFSADEALAWGLVGQVVAADELPVVATAVAAKLAAGPTRAYAATKRLIQAAAQPPLPEVLAAESEAQSALGLTSDHAGAVQAFLAKRKPEFHGR